MRRYPRRHLIAGWLSVVLKHYTFGLNNIAKCTGRCRVSRKTSCSRQSILPGLNNTSKSCHCSKAGKGFGGIVSFTLKHDTEEAATAFVTSTQLFKLAESLGGIKSLLCHPAQMTHKTIPAEKRSAAGVADSLIRLSIGLEDADDLVNDLKNAFTACKKQLQVKKNLQKTAAV